MLSATERRKKTSLQFREEVLKYWLNRSQEAVIQCDESTSIIAQEQNSLHYLEPIPPTPQNINPTRKCRVLQRKTFERRLDITVRSALICLHYVLDFA